MVNSKVSPLQSPEMAGGFLQEHQIMIKKKTAVVMLESTICLVHSKHGSILLDIIDIVCLLILKGYDIETTTESLIAEVKSSSTAEAYDTKNWNLKLTLFAQFERA